MITGEQILMSRYVATTIIQIYCRKFWPRRPLTAYEIAVNNRVHLSLRVGASRTANVWTRGFSHPPTQASMSRLFLCRQNCSDSMQKHHCSHCMAKQSRSCDLQSLMHSAMNKRRPTMLSWCKAITPTPIAWIWCIAWICMKIGWCDCNWRWLAECRGRRIVYIPLFWK